MEEDTIKLLKECDAGVKMGITSIDEVLEHVHDEKLKELLKESKENHSKLELELNQELNKYDEDGKEPAAMAKVMSWVKTNVKLMGEEPDSVVADLITEGCNMGIKTLYKYLNQYSNANDKAKKLLGEIVQEEEILSHNLRVYL